MTTPAPDSAEPADAPIGGARAPAYRRLARLIAAPRHLAVALFIASLALRGATAIELSDTPLFRHAQWDQTDNNFFVQWAGRIADGDWLGHTALHPYHEWQARIARHAARAYGIPYTDAAGREIWNDWYGGRRFHQEPLYPYLLAVIRAATGDVRCVFLLQAICGALTTVLLFAIGRQLHGTAAGLIAAMAHLAYGPMTYYDLMLHRTSLQSFGGVLTVYCVLQAWQRRRRRDYAVLGAVLGANMLLASTAGIELAMLVVAILVTGRLARQRREAVRRAMLTTGMAALVISPAVLRNIVVGVPPFEMSSVAAITFVDANSSDVDPAAGFMQSQHATDIMMETGGHFVDAVWATLLHHVGTGWFVMVGRKLVYFFTPVEIPNNDSFAYYASYSRILGGSFLGFGLLGPLFAMGIGAGIAHRRTAWPVLLHVSLGLGMTLLFYNLSRFRAPVVAAALPLVGMAIVELARALRQRRLAPVLLMAGLAVLPTVALRLASPVTALPIRADDAAQGALMWQSLIREARTPAQGKAIAVRALCDGPRLDFLLGEGSPWSKAGRALVGQRLAEIEHMTAGIPAIAGAPRDATQIPSRCLPVLPYRPTLAPSRGSRDA